MTSTAITAQGSTLQIDVAVPGTPDTEIENVISYTGFDAEAAEIDITNLSSTAKEKLLGLQDFGSFSMEIHPDFDAGAAGQNDLRAAQASGAEKAFLLTLPDGTTVAFSARVQNATSITGGVDAALAGSVSLTITGDIVITPPA